MNCPICDKEMQEGGLVIDGVLPHWISLDQFQAKGLKRLRCKNPRYIGKRNTLLRETRVSNAFFCENCDKIVGIFDVTNDED